MIPFSTTTLTITRPDETADPYDSPTVATLETGRAAAIVNPSATDLRVGGNQETVQMVALVDPDCTVRLGDYATDDQTGDQWRVIWTQQRVGVGLDHVKVGLTRTTGSARG